MRRVNKAYGSRASTATPAVATESRSEGDVLEFIQEAAALESYHLAIEDASDVRLALEELQTTVRGFEGGMTAQTAQLLQVAVNAHLRRLGATKEIVPALESFSDDRRASASQIALEGLGDAIKKVWDAIIGAIKRFVDWIKSFFTKATTHTAPIAQKAEELKEKAAVLDTPKAKAKRKPKAKVATEDASAGHQIAEHLSNQHIATMLWSSKGFLHPEALANTHHYAKFVGEFGKTYGEFKNYLLSNLKQIGSIKEQGAQEFFKDIQVMPMAELLNEKGIDVVNPGEHGVHVSGEGLEVVCSKEMLGGKSVYVVGPKEAKGEAAMRAFGEHASYSIKPFDPHHTPEASEELPLLERHEAEALCEVVKDMCKSLDDHQSLLSEMESGNREMMSEIERVSKLPMDDVSAEMQRAHHVYQKLMQRFILIISGMFSTAVSYILPTAKAMLSYVEMCIAFVGHDEPAAV